MPLDNCLYVSASYIRSSLANPFLETGLVYCRLGSSSTNHNNAELFNQLLHSFIRSTINVHISRVKFSWWTLSKYFIERYFLSPDGVLFAQPYCTKNKDLLHFVYLFLYVRVLLLDLSRAILVVVFFLDIKRVIVVVKRYHQQGNNMLESCGLRNQKWKPNIQTQWILYVRMYINRVFLWWSNINLFIFYFIIWSLTI